MHEAIAVYLQVVQTEYKIGIAAEHAYRPPLNGWTDYHDFPPFADESFHDWWRKNRGK